MTNSAMIASLYQDRTAAARRWKSAGGKVIGYFADDVPTALIEAAGFLPYRISGDPCGGQPQIMARGPIDVRADRLEFVNSWVHMIDQGRYDFVDHFIVSNSRKYILQLAERLRALAAPPSFHILDRALGTSPAAVEYNRRQVPKLQSVLERWAGTPIQASEATDSIARHNRRADALARIASMRERARPVLPGLDALHIISLARWMHSAEYLPLIEGVNEGTPRSGLRLFLSGSGHDQDAAYAAIEAQGAVIVGESHNWSARLLEAKIGEGYPLAAIADHYANNADFIVPLGNSIEQARMRCTRSSAEAVMSMLYAHDEAPLWEMPTEQAAFGLPCVCVAEMPYRIEQERLTAALATLGERMPA